MLDFLFVIESPLRELRSVLLLCEELKRRGYSAEYIYGGLEWHGKRPRVIVSNTIFSKEEVLHGIVKYNYRIKKVVNLLWEQALTQEATISRTEIMCNVARSFNYMLWQKNDYYTQLQRRDVDEKKLFITGPVAFDFLRKEFDELYKSSIDLKSEYGISESQRILLFISPFAHANPSEEALEIAARYDSMELIQREYEFDRKTKEVLLDWFEKLIQDTPDITIVYRTHPRMNECDRVKKLNEENSRFRWICDDSLQQWIKVSDYITTVYSTSIAECTVANKKCIVLRPYEMVPQLDVCFYDETTSVRTYNDFFYMIEKDDGDYASKLIEKYDITDIPSYIRVADALEKILRNREYNIKWTMREKLFCKLGYIKLHCNIGNLVVIFKKMLGLFADNDSIELINGIEVKRTQDIIRKIVYSRI